MKNLILILSRKYKKDTSISILLNSEIKKEIKKEIEKYKYLDSKKEILFFRYVRVKGENSNFIDGIEDSEYYFNPYNILYFIKNKTIIADAIIRALLNIGIKYEEDKLVISNSFGIKQSNIETLSEETNKEIWELCVSLLKPQITDLYKRIKSLNMKFNMSKVYNNSNRNINIYEISYLFYLSRPDKFFPIDKNTKKILAVYDNNLLKDINTECKNYLRFCLDNSNNRLDRELLVECSIGDLDKDRYTNSLLTFLHSKFDI